MDPNTDTFVQHLQKSVKTHIYFIMVFINDLKYIVAVIALNNSLSASNDMLNVLLK